MDRIVFYSSIPGLPDIIPIKKASEFKFAWIDRAKEDYKKYLSCQDPDKGNHLYKCPGIFELIGEGYIIPMWHDVVIETSGDRRTFKWKTPSPILQDMMDPTPIIDSHTKLASLLPYPEKSMELIIKFNTPWHVITPKNVKLLIIPIPYPDNYEFASVSGILDPSVENEINIQLFWYATNSQITIKAGTPMMQIIPLTEKKYDMICREMTLLDELWMKKKKFFRSCSWNFKRNLVSQAFKKHYKL